MVVVDPPFITLEVWSKYTEAIKFLLPSDENGSIKGKVLCSTIDENKNFMKELLDVDPIVYRPSIPNLVYQYNFYTNYEDETCNEQNPEIPDAD